MTEREKELNNVFAENIRDYKSMDFQNKSNVVLHDSIVGENNETTFYNLLPEKLGKQFRLSNLIEILIENLCFSFFNLN